MYFIAVLTSRTTPLFGAMEQLMHIMDVSWSECNLRDPRLHDLEFRGLSRFVSKVRLPGYKHHPLAVGSIDIELDCGFALYIFLTLLTASLPSVRH